MSNQPIKNQEYVFYIFLVSRSTGQFQSNPTIAAGDFKRSIDGAAYANFTNLPAVDPAGSKSVKITLSATEMNCSNLVWLASDAAGDEWDEVGGNIQPISWLDTNDDITGLAANTVTASALDADAVTEIQSGLATAANLATVAGYLDTEIAAILADTNELQTDWVNGGRLDLILDARASQTTADAIETDTQNIQSRLPAALTADGNMKADTLRVGGTLQTAGDIIGDTNDIQSRLPAALSGDGFIKADLLSIGDELVSGNNATLNLKKLNIVNNAGNALDAVSTGGNGIGAYFQGNGTGYGMDINAGQNGTGLKIDGGSLSGGGVVIDSYGDIQDTVGIYNNGDGGSILGLAGLDPTTPSIWVPNGILGSDSEDLSVTNITDKVWDEATAGHATAGTTGKALTDAGSAGDPWGTSLPGAYGAGTAGKIIGDNINATISSRATQTSVDDLPTNAELATALNAIPTAGENADAVWDEIVTAGQHNVKNSAATILRKASGGQEVTIHAGTAQAGTSNTIQLDTGASATNDVYNGNIVALTGGTGAGQTRRIVDYIGATRTAYVDSVWVTSPDNSTTFEIIAAPSSVLSDEGVAQGGGSDYIDLATTASSLDDTYNNSLVTITSGAGSGQTKVVTDYTGASRRASIAPDTWSVNPDNTSVYAVIPSSTTAADSGTPVVVPTSGEIADAVWDELKADHAVADTFGDYLDDEITSRSSHSAADVWAVGTRTLTSFGTLVADIWSNATRTLTAISDSSGVTTILSRIGSALNISGGKVESNIKQINGTNVTGDGSGTPWGPE